MMDDYLRLYDYVLPLYMLCALWFLRDTAVVRVARRETVVSTFDVSAATYTAASIPSPLPLLTRLVSSHSSAIFPHLHSCPLNYGLHRSIDFNHRFHSSWVLNLRINSGINSRNTTLNTGRCHRSSANWSYRTTWVVG